MTIRVENNFIENNFFWNLVNTITNNDFPWYIEGEHNDLVHNLIYEPDLKKENSFYANKILSPIIEKLNPKNIVSAKITLNYSSPKKEKTLPSEENIDLSNKSFKGFLCMNTNNSEMDIVGVDKISLIENRFISFSKNNSYSISTHTDTRCRIVVEFIYDI